MQRYPWLNSVYNQILSFYSKDKGHHALLFNSKRDNGEDILINALVRWLLCSCPNGSQYCNICYDCKLMNAGNHPDYYKLDSKNYIRTIGVDIVRVCVGSIYKHACSNRVKIIFIKYVEYLTDAAINVLLKVLDEPPRNTYFFLKTKDYTRTAPTLLSRCMRWSIVSPTESCGLQWLMKQQVVHDVLFAQCSLRLCDGAPIEAGAMFKSGLWTQRLELCKSVNDVIKNGNFLKLVPFLSTYQNNVYYLYWFISILVDALKWKYGIKKKFIINLDQVELITVVSNNWSTLFLTNQLQQWLLLLRYFQEFNNIDRELLLTYRLLNWQQGIVESCLS